MNKSRNNSSSDHPRWVNAFGATFTHFDNGINDFLPFLRERSKSPVVWSARVLTRSRAIARVKRKGLMMEKIGGKCDTFKCDVCGEEMSKVNKSRHMKLHERNEH